MKILILANCISGLLSFRKEVVESFISQKHEVFISTPDKDQSEILTSMGARLFFIPIDRRGTSLHRDMVLMVKYIKLLKSIRPDVVLTYTIKPNIYGGLACRFLRIPQIANITGLGSAIMGNDGIFKKLLIQLYRLGLSRAKTIFFQNSKNQEFCISHKIADKDRAKLLPGSGVNLYKFSYMEYPSDDGIRFLYIGRLMKDKGTDELLYVAKEVTQKYENVEFHIIGSFEENYNDIIENYMKKGMIFYHGHQNNVRSWIEKCSCIIHPSYHEGMSNVILEGSACGRPIITTDINGCKEAVDNGKSGFLAKPRNPEDLLAKVEKFLTISLDGRRNMGIAARAKMEATFDRNIVINAYNAKINELSRR